MKIRGVQGGGSAEYSFKTAAGETHVTTHGQKYGRSQGSPAETNAFSKLIPQFINSVLNLVFPV